MTRINEFPQHVKDAEKVLDSLRLSTENIIHQSKAQRVVDEWQEERMAAITPSVTIEDFKKQIRITVESEGPMDNRQNDLIADVLSDLLEKL